MKNLNRIMAIILLTQLVSCTTKVYKIVKPAPALREIFRGGKVRGLDNKRGNNEVNPQGLAGNGGHFTDELTDYDRIEHTCTSTPQYDFRGNYMRTDVRCW